MIKGHAPAVQEGVRMSLLRCLCGCSRKGAKHLTSLFPQSGKQKDVSTPTFFEKWDVLGLEPGTSAATRPNKQ